MDKREFELKRQRQEIYGSILTHIAKWVPLCIIAYFAYLSIAAVAGKTTLASFQMFLSSDLKANTAFSHIVTAIFGIGGISYGAKERGLRRQMVKRLGDQNRHLESKFDQNRSSSRLMSDGKTRPEDQI